MAPASPVRPVAAARSPADRESGSRLPAVELRTRAARPVSGRTESSARTLDDIDVALSSCIGAPKQHRAYGSWVIAASMGLALIALLRRRRR